MAGEKILIVEDNPVNMELATDLLEIGGYQVCQATDAETGITMAREAAPDLILMDVGLPGMDGLSAAILLRQDAATQHIPIVILTAHAMKGDEEKARACGCAGYITKPINTRTFANTVAGFIAASRAG
ncbi:MAG: response regulator [Armatimonadota bacterium]|nr:response regulator [Armatimonadota bacterium]